MNAYTIQQNLLDTAIAVLGGKSIAVETYMKKVKGEINN